MEQKTFGYSDNKFLELGFRGFWEYEDNREGIKEIITNFLEENPFGEVKYFMWGTWLKWKDIKKFDYEKYIEKSPLEKREIKFYGESEEGVQFCLRLNLIDKFVGRGERKYSNAKYLGLQMYYGICEFKLIENYMYFLYNKFKIFSGDFTGAFGKNGSISFQEKYFQGRGYRYTRFANLVGIAGQFIFQKIVDKKLFIDTIKPIVYKLEELEDGGIYIQVNEKDPLNLHTEENQKNYITYLKALAEILPIGGVQSIYHDAYMIKEFGALEGRWHLIRDVNAHGKIYYDLIKEHAPEVLDEKGDFKISDEDWKLLGKLPQAKYKYITVKKK